MCTTFRSAHSEGGASYIVGVCQLLECWLLCADNSQTLSPGALEYSCRHTDSSG